MNQEQLSQERQRLANFLRFQLSLLEDERLADFPLIELLRFPRAAEDERVEDIQRDLRQVLRRLDDIRWTRTGCRLAGDAGDSVLEMVTGIGGRLDQDRKYVQQALRPATNLTVIDPYFFSWNGANRAYKTPTAYLDFVCSLVPPSAESVEVIHLPGPNANLIHRFKKKMSARHVKFRSVENAEFHDRFLIADDKSAMLLGTSLGGLGNKISIALPLPPDDLQKVLTEVRRIRAAV